MKVFPMSEENASFLTSSEIAWVDAERYIPYIDKLPYTGIVFFSGEAEARFPEGISPATSKLPDFENARKLIEVAQRCQIAIEIDCEHLDEANVALVNFAQNNEDRNKLLSLVNGGFHHMINSKNGQKYQEITRWRNNGMQVIDGEGTIDWDKVRHDIFFLVPDAINSLRIEKNRCEGTTSFEKPKAVNPGLLSELKRYDIEQHHPSGSSRYGVMVAQDDGEFVEYDAAERLFNHLAAKIEHLEQVVSDMSTQITSDDESQTSFLEQAKNVQTDVKELTASLRLHRNALNRARTYVEMIATDQHFTTETEDADLELIDLVLGDHRQTLHLERKMKGA